VHGRILGREEAHTVEVVELLLHLALGMIGIIYLIHPAVRRG
jgi:hypothetical protein